VGEAPFLVSGGAVEAAEKIAFAHFAIDDEDLVTGDGGSSESFTDLGCPQDGRTLGGPVEVEAGFVRGTVAIGAVEPRPVFCEKRGKGGEGEETGQNQREPGIGSGTVGNHDGKKHRV
jgi:hypothetical protein